MTQGRILPIEHIEVEPTSGMPRVRGAGVKVEFLHWFMNNPEWTVERICQEYSLTPGQVYAAWSYYCDHKQEMEQLIAQREARLAEYRRRYPEIARRSDEFSDMMRQKMQERQKVSKA